MKTLRRVLYVAGFVALFAMTTGCGKDIVDPTNSHTLTVANNCGTVVEIFIDNNQRGFVQPGQNRQFSLKEGGHTVTIQDQSGQYTISVSLDMDKTVPTCG